MISAVGWHQIDCMAGNLLTILYLSTTKQTLPAMLYVFNKKNPCAPFVRVSCYRKNKQIT